MSTERALGLIEDMAVIEDVGEAAEVAALLRWLQAKGLLRLEAAIRECARCRTPFVAGRAGKVGRPAEYCSERCRKPRAVGATERSRERSRANGLTVLERYGHDFFRRIGAKGGRAQRVKRSAA